MKVIDRHPTSPASESLWIPQVPGTLEGVGAYEHPSMPKGSELQPLASRVYSEEESARLSRELLAHFSSQPVDLSPFIHENTKRRRHRLWEAWTKFCEPCHVDPHASWVRLVEMPQTPDAQAPFRAFLTHYVKTSARVDVVLDQREQGSVQSVTSAHSVKEVWRALVAAAEEFVLAPLRARNREMRHLTLYDNRRGEGPASVIVQWLFKEAAPSLGLETRPEYKKVEVTSADVILIVQTLWSHPHEIPCSNVVRAGFHFWILLLGLGFRPGVLKGFKYSQIQVWLLRDPQNQSRRRIVITLDMKQNKIKKTAQITPSRGNGWLAFSITPVPNPTICLASLILARAVQDNAFEADFTTTDEILDVPKLDTVDAVILRWKKEAEERPIFPMTYKTFSGLWHLILRFLGYRTTVRVYALRVGSVGRYLGVLTDALSNYILGHTTDVKERSYLTYHVKENLLELAFPEHYGESGDSMVFHTLRNTSLTRDPGAPWRLTPEQESQFESRRDVTQLRADIARASAGREKCELKNKLETLKRRWALLKLADIREKYFESADRLRASGMSVPRAWLAGDIIRSDSTAEKPVAEFLKNLEPKGKEDRDARSRAYMRLLYRYLINETRAAKTKSARDDGVKISEVERQTVGPLACESKSRCLLCKDCRPFSSRASLTRHHAARHLREQFKQPFLCPECRRTGLETTITSPGEWSNHVETTHGKANAPNLPRAADLGGTCWQCDRAFADRLTLLNHANKHVRAGILEWTSQQKCWVCAVHGVRDVKPENIWQWLGHFRADHMPEARFCPFCGLLCSTVGGLTRHMMAHASLFPILCPLCRQQPPPQYRIDSIDQWHEHLEAAHTAGQNCRIPAREEIAGSKRKRTDGEPRGLKKLRSDNLEGCTHGNPEAAADSSLIRLSAAATAAVASMNPVSGTPGPCLEAGNSERYSFGMPSSPTSDSDMTLIGENQSPSVLAVRNTEVEQPSHTAEGYLPAPRIASPPVTSMHPISTPRRRPTDVTDVDPQSWHMRFVGMIDPSTFANAAGKTGVGEPIEIRTAERVPGGEEEALNNGETDVAERPVAQRRRSYSPDMDTDRTRDATDQEAPFSAGYTPIASPLATSMDAVSTCSLGPTDDIDVDLPSCHMGFVSMIGPSKCAIAPDKTEVREPIGIRTAERASGGEERAVNNGEADTTGRLVAQHRHPCSPGMDADRTQTRDATDQEAPSSGYTVLAGSEGSFPSGIEYTGELDEIGSQLGDGRVRSSSGQLPVEELKSISSSPQSVQWLSRRATELTELSTQSRDDPPDQRPRRKRTFSRRFIEAKETEEALASLRRTRKRRRPV